MLKKFSICTRAAVICATSLLALAGSAYGAEVKLDRACYVSDMEANVNGSGFGANSAINFTLDTSPLGSSTADATGSFAVKFNTPKLSDDVAEKTGTLSATDGTQSASTPLNLTQIAAGFQATPGSSALVNKAKVRFIVFGFGLLKENPNVFAHYVQPNGKHIGTVKIGQAQGPCGKISPSKVFKFYPFKAKLKGYLLLQIDTNAKYKKADVNKDPIFVTLKVKIKRVLVNRSKTTPLTTASPTQLKKLSSLL